MAAVILLDREDTLPVHCPAENSCRDRGRDWDWDWDNCHSDQADDNHSTDREADYREDDYSYSCSYSLGHSAVGSTGLAYHALSEDRGSDRRAVQGVRGHNHTLDIHPFLGEVDTVPWQGHCDSNAENAAENVAEMAENAAADGYFLQDQRNRYCEYSTDR